MPTDTQVNDLKINVLSEAQYEQIQSPSDTEMYLVPETVDTTPTSGSTNPITSGGVYNALQNIPEQEQSDWSETDATDPAYIKNKPQNIVTDAGYVHTDNNYTTTEKSKLADIEAGAEKNVQSDWNQSDNTKDDYIKNKPTIPSAPGTLNTTNTTAQSTSSSEALSGTVNLHKVAKTGTYSDLIGLPAALSYFTNDTNFITLNDVPTEVVYFTWTLSGGLYTSSMTPANILAALKTETKCVIGINPIIQSSKNERLLYHCIGYVEDSKEGTFQLFFTHIDGSDVYSLYYDSSSKWNYFKFRAQELLIGTGTGQNIKTINGNSLLGSGDLTIGDNVTVDTEISETSTNPVQNQVIGIELRKLWNKKEIVGRIDNEYQKKNGYINSSGTWTNSTTIKHCIIPCNDIKEFTITSDPNVSSHYTFLKTYTEGTPPSSTYAEGYSGRKDYRLGTHTYKVPKDAQYLYLGFGSTPVSLLFTGIGITNKLDDLSDYPSIDDNSGKVLAVNSEATGVEWVEQSGGDTEEVFVCNYDISNNTMDKTPAEIVEAKDANKIVICKLSYPTTDFLLLNQANSNPFVVFTGFSQTTSSTSVLTVKYHVLRYTTTDGWKFFTFDIQQRLVVDTEISETSTNPVQNKTIGIELRKLWNKKDIVSRLDNEYESHNNYIATASGKWVSSSTYKHWIVPVADIREVTVESNSSTAAYIAFLDSYESTTYGTTPDYSDGWETTVSVAVGGKRTFKVPEGAMFMYLNTGNNGEAKAAHIYMTGIGITDEFELPSLDNNAGKVLTVNSTETDVEWTKPVTIYSGTSAPSSSLGADGDIYIQIQS